MNPNELIIHEGNYQSVLDGSAPDGFNRARGLIPRNFAMIPHGSLPQAPGFSMPTIPQAEWPSRLAEKIQSGTRLSDVRLRGAFGQPIPSQDQNGQGFCWKYGGTARNMLARALANMPFVQLSAHAAACIIKNFKDEGGWCGEALKFETEVGEAPASMWPLRAMSRSLDTPALRQEMAKYRVTEGYYDLGAPIWNQKMTFDQVATCLLLSIPTQGDFNWWGHSVCLLDLVDGSTTRAMTRVESGKLATLPEFETIWQMSNPVTGGFGLRIWNSWGESWSDRGMGILTGSKAIPDGAVAIAVAA